MKVFKNKSLTYLINIRSSTKSHFKSVVKIISKVKDFLLRIQTTTLACWKSDASLLDEDKEFLENMKTDRTFTIGSLDLKRLQVAERKADKLSRQDDYYLRNGTAKNKYAAWFLTQHHRILVI